MQLGGSFAAQICHLEHFVSGKFGIELAPSVLQAMVKCADRSSPRLLISQTSRGREQILHMELQAAGDLLDFARCDGRPFHVSIFQLQNYSVDRSCGFVQNFTQVLMLCLGHRLTIPV
jgi:hypothetical protein